MSTVSRILNNRSDGFSVKGQTRQRVMEAAEELKYRPDPIVRTIRAKRTNLVAILGLQDFGTTIRGTTEEAVNALTDRLYDAGLELCTNVLSPRVPPYQLPGWRVDGAVIVDCPNVEALSDVDASGVPYVTINCPAGPNGSSVRVDDAGGARAAVHHLLALGHRKIAYVPAFDPGAMPKSHVDPKAHESVTRRHQGYIEALKECGVDPLMAELPQQRDALDAMRHSVLDLGATALVVYHHLMAVRLLRAAAMLGLRVPQDVSIVCFNDLFPCSDMVPSLSAMSIPGHDMGRAAAEILVSQIERNATEPRHMVWPETLMSRDSSGPAPTSSEG